MIRFVFFFLIGLWDPGLASAGCRKIVMFPSSGEIQTSKNGGEGIPFPSAIEKRERSFGEIVANSSTHDFGGRYAVEGDTKLGYGRHLFILVEIEGQVRAFTVPEFNLEDSLMNGNLQTGYFGSHEGLWQEVLRHLPYGVSAQVLSAGELLVTGKHEIFEIYGRSGTFRGDESHLEFAASRLPGLGFDLASGVSKSTYAMRPIPSIRHAATEDLATGTTKEDLKNLATNQIRVQLDSQLKTDYELLIEFVSILIKMKPHGWRDHYHKYVFSYTEGNEHQRYLASKLAMYYIGMVSSFVKIEPEQFVLNVVTKSGYGFLRRQILEILNLWIEDTPADSRSFDLPFSTGQLKEWKKFRSKVKKSLECNRQQARCL